MTTNVVTYVAAKDETVRVLLTHTHMLHSRKDNADDGKLMSSIGQGGIIKVSDRKHKK